MQTPLLRVRDLQVHFSIRRGFFRREVGQLRAVDGISFDVMARETLGIVGESGCGKSTLAKSLMGLYEPTAGHVHLQDDELTSLRAKALKSARQKIQMVFQDPFLSLNPSHRVHRLVERPMAIHKLYSRTERQIRALQLLEKCGIDKNSAHLYPSQFSGGQRQRIGIARALSLYPDLLILDEPVSALDVSIQAQILNLLQELQDELGLSYVFISHDLGVIRMVSHRIAVMYLGKFVEFTTTRELFDEPLHPYTRALLSAIPVPDPKVNRQRSKLSGEPPSPVKPPTGCPFHTRCPDALERCKHVQPEWREVKPGHHVSCHLHDSSAS